MVLAKMTGFPAWPSFVMPTDMIPSPIMKAKKKSTTTCVIFIPDGDFYWMNEKALEPLSQDALRAKISKLPKDKLRNKAKKKSARTNNVADALVAAEDLLFDDFMDSLALYKDAINDADEESDEENGVPGEAQDEDDDDDPIDNAGESDSDNAKNESDSDGKNESQDPADDLPSSDKVKPRKRGRRRDAIESDDEPDTSNDHNGNEEDEKSTEKSPLNGSGEDPETDQPSRKSKRGTRSSSPKKDTKRPKRGTNGTTKEVMTAKPIREAGSASPKPMDEKERQHQLWLCRIKLQRSLIQRNQPVTPKDPRDFPPPTVDELLVARIILHRLADFPVSMELLRDTKIHKVLKCILKDSDLEYPDSFRLHEKCEELLDKWAELIENLKQEKQLKDGSRIGSQAPEDSEVSGMETKKTLETDYAEKVEV